MFKAIYLRVSSVALTGMLLATLLVHPVAAQETNTADTPTPAGTSADEATVPSPGTNRQTAGRPLDTAVTIAPGETNWYRFRYVFDEERDSEPGNAVVMLKMSEPGCARFEVTTTGRLNFPFDDNGDWVGPIGRGTPFNNGSTTNPSTLVWVGGGRFSETHYVIVQQRGPNPCTYTLTITGSPVVF
jgi:hypothetical protein